MIYLGAVVKNISKNFNLFRDILLELKENFHNFVICIYEDNSTDNTKELLESLKRDFNNVNLFCETFNWLELSKIRTWDNKPCRIECISTARNKLMNLLEENGMGNMSNDLCIMIDPDIPVKFDLSRLIYWCKNFPESTDAIFANGVDKEGKYYDTFAYRDINYPLSTDIFSESNIQRNTLKHSKLNCKLPENLKIPVYSAFGGLAIYRASSIKGIRYSSFPTFELNDFYKKFIRENSNHSEVKLVKNVQQNIKTHFQGSLLGSYLFGKNDENSLFYYNCWGYNFPIVCEHVTFHIEMIKKGYTKLFVYTDIVYKSDH